MSTDQKVKRSQNFHVVLRKRPGVNNEPSVEDFGYEPCPYPQQDSMKEGELLIQSLYLSVDPALRCMMNENTGVMYAPAWQLHETLQGAGGVGEVVVSQSQDYRVGDRVVAAGFWPWANYFILSAEQVHPIPPVASQLPSSLFLSVFGLTGLTAYLGVTATGHVVQGQTMVVSAAAGATGCLAGQIAREEGCARVVGICGTDVKCHWLTEQLGFDAAINYKTQDVSERLADTCPDGVDLYFDNVGGAISDHVIRKMKNNSAIILCGQISQYNTDVPYPPPVSQEIAAILAERNISRERFLVLAHKDQFETTIQKLMELYMAGKLKIQETVAIGLCDVGQAFVSMMKGGNIGKQIVQL